MTAIISAAVIFVVFAVGDMISAKTKAIVSMLLVASVVFLAGFWTGVFPTTLFADSTLLSMAGLLVTMLLVHLGTTIRLPRLRRPVAHRHHLRRGLHRHLCCRVLHRPADHRPRLRSGGRAHSLRRRCRHPDHAGYGQQSQPA